MTNLKSIICIFLLTNSNILAANTSNTFSHKRVVRGFRFNRKLREEIENLRLRIHEPLLFQTTYKIDLDDYDIPYLTGVAGIQDLMVAGLRNFIITYVNVDTIGRRINLSFSVPKISIQARHFQNAKIAELFPVQGNGPILLQLNNIWVTFNASVAIRGFRIEKIEFKNTHVGVNYESVKIEIDGLSGSKNFSDYIAKLIHKGLTMGTKYIQQFPNIVSAIISPEIERIANNVLKGKELN